MNQSEYPIAPELSSDDVRQIEQLQHYHERLKTELAKVIVGQTDVVEQLTTVLFARGHGLLMGVPGLAKTLLVSKLAETMALLLVRQVLGQYSPNRARSRHLSHCFFPDVWPPISCIALLYATRLKPWSPPY